MDISYYWRWEKTTN